MELLILSGIFNIRQLKYKFFSDDIGLYIDLWLSCNIEILCYNFDEVFFVEVDRIVMSLR
jgi:hypothetical protein